MKNLKVTAVTRNLHQKGYILKTQANPGYLDIVESNIFNIPKIEELIAKSDVCINLIGILFEKGSDNFTNIHEKFPNMISSLCKKYNLTICNNLILMKLSFEDLAVRKSET